LLPQNLAEVATKGAVENREKNIARIKAKQEKLHSEALELAKKFEELSVIELSAKAGESGKLFGTVTTKKLAEEIKEKLGVTVDRKDGVIKGYPDTLITDLPGIYSMSPYSSEEDMPTLDTDLSQLGLTLEERFKLEDRLVLVLNVLGDSEPSEKSATTA
jgi:hypothetical protein